MISPKRSKYRKPHRGRLKGRISSAKVIFGDYGIQATEAVWLTSRQIEARRRVLTRYVRRGGKLWIRIFPDNFITIRPAETRMGSGKGNPEYWIAVIRPGTLLFELCGISTKIAHQATQIAVSKLPTKAQFVVKSSESL